MLMLIKTCANAEYHSSTGNRSRLSGALLIFRQTASAERPKPGGKIRVTHHECTKQTRNDANVRSRVAKPKPSIELAKTVVTTVKYAQRGRVAEWQSSRVAILDSSTRCRQKKKVVMRCVEVQRDSRSGVAGSQSTCFSWALPLPDRFSL